MPRSEPLLKKSRRSLGSAASSSPAPPSPFRSPPRSPLRSPPSSSRPFPLLRPSQRPRARLASSSLAPRLDRPLLRTPLPLLNASRQPRTVCILLERRRLPLSARSVPPLTRARHARPVRDARLAVTRPGRPCHRRSTSHAAIRTSTTMLPASTSSPATITLTRTG